MMISSWLPGRISWFPGKRLLPYLIILSCACACENIDLSSANTEGGEGTSSGTVAAELPKSTGRGTQASPYTVADFLQLDHNTGDIWVMGYAVAATYNQWANMEFDRNTSFKTNIILSDDSLCSSKESGMLIPVELSSAKYQKAFSIYHNPDLYRQCVVLKARRSMYFGHPGLRSVSEGYWLPAFDISSLPDASAEDMPSIEYEY